MQNPTLYRKVVVPVHKAVQDVSEMVSQLLGGIPLCDEATKQVSPVLIIGCGRSGSTLLRSMLVAGGHVAIPPESYVWPQVLRRFALLRFARWDRLSKTVIDAFEMHPEFYTWDFDLQEVRSRATQLPPARRSLASVIDVIYGGYAAQHGQPGQRWGDKTPVNTLFLPLVAQVFPEAQYVHVIRDPRAVALSYVQAAKGSRGIGVSTYQAAADRWVEAVSRSRALGRRLGSGRYVEVLYEDLVRTPESELKKVCAFLDLPFTPGMLEFYGHADKLGDTRHHEHHRGVRGPLDISRIDQWEQDLDLGARRLVEDRTRMLAWEYGYGLTAGPNGS
jgi:hypothetical protein